MKQFKAFFIAALIILVAISILATIYIVYFIIAAVVFIGIYLGIRKVQDMKENRRWRSY